MSFEYSPKAKRGFYTCWPQVGLAVGLSLAMGVVALLTKTLSDEAFLAWGWRVAFMGSIVLVGLGLFVRLRILETPEFAKIKDAQKIAHVPVGEVFRDYKKNVLLGWGARWIDAVVFNVYAVFTIAYLVGTVHLDKTGVLLGISAAAFILIFTIPIASAWSDRVGRRTAYGWGALVCGIAAGTISVMFPQSSTMVVSPYFWVLIAVALFETVAIYLRGFEFGPPLTMRTRVLGFCLAVGTMVVIRLGGGVE